jgi:hypothetical protein
MSGQETNMDGKELFVVMDKAFFGRGVFGVFSASEKADSCCREIKKEAGYETEVRRIAVEGGRSSLHGIFIAHTYDKLHDLHVFDGLYCNAQDAREAAGREGLIVRFLIDQPDSRTIITGD